MVLIDIHKMIIFFMEVSHQIRYKLTWLKIINIHQNLIDISFILFMKIFDILIILNVLNLFCILIVIFR
jgi:hypothetical protein